nr:hypothetical protein [Tanacetum cinerariifolium]
MMKIWKVWMVMVILSSFWVVRVDTPLIGGVDLERKVVVDKSNEVMNLNESQVIQQSLVEVRDGMIVGDGLTLAVIPGDSGKPTARLEKAKQACCMYQFKGLQDQREVDGSENVNGDNKILTTKLSNGDKEGSLRSDPSE